MSGPIPDPIRLVGLTLGYDRHPAVHHLDGSVRAGDLLALVGPNGAGKSTLLKGMAGEIRCLDGRIERAGALAYMPQVDEIDRSFPLTVMDLAGMGLWRRAGAWRSLTRSRPAIQAALATVGLDGFAARPIGTLSGGQFRRALFARLILQDCPVVLLDEPFTGIDARTVDDLLALIRAWHSEGRTVVAPVSQIDMRQQGGSLQVVKAGASLAAVVKGLNALGATPADLQTILEAMRAAGALRAELEVI